MAAKKITKVIKLQVPAGKAAMVVPVGPVLGQAGINGQQFCQKFNEQTQAQIGYNLPVVITVYEDRSFEFIVKTPPAADLLLKAAGITSGSANASKNKVGKITTAQLRDIAAMKLPDLNAYTVEAGMKIIAGTAKNMGIVVED